MVRQGVDSGSRSKKRHRKHQSEDEESDADNDSPRRSSKKTKLRQTSLANQNKTKKSHEKKPKKVDSSSSRSSSASPSPPKRSKHDTVKRLKTQHAKEESSSESRSPSPPKRTKSDRHKRHRPKQHHDTHKNVESSASDSSRSRSPAKHVKRDRDNESKVRQHHETQSSSKLGDKGKYNHRDIQRHRKTDRATEMRIKREEDFDRRQEDIRRQRRRENERRERNPYDFKVKKERFSDSEGSRNRMDRQGNRHRSRNDVERERRENDARRAEAWQRREREGGQNAEALREDTAEPKEKEKPNLGLSGALTEDTNTFRGVVIKYSEPPEARVPKKKWRLYPFKGDEALKVLHLHRQSAYLLGKLRRIADIPIDHPSCSKQHAVFQFRMVEEEKMDGTKKKIIKPYIIDLDSANGTFVNNQKIQPRRFVELKEQDVLKFAFSSREYVLIHDKSDTTEVEISEKEASDVD